MSDDITFCMIGSCKHKTCFRHNSNIKDSTIPHSYAIFEGTEDCPYNGKGMTYKEAANELKNYHRNDGSVPEEITLAIKALEERLTGKWIPVTTRRMTDNEIIDAIGYGAWEELDESDKIDFWVYTCPLPKSGEKVLITTSYANGGDVVLTRFYANAEGSYFEDYELQTEVLAWQPLPEAYKKGTEE